MSNNAHIVHRCPTLRLDQLTDLDPIDKSVLYMTERMVKHAWDKYNMVHRINSSYRKGDSGYHGRGLALDLVLYTKTPGDVHWLTQFVIACRFDFGGIGVYPYWSAPGIHVDMRDARDPRALWWQDEHGTYRHINELHMIGGTHGASS